MIDRSDKRFTTNQASWRCTLFRDELRSRVAVDQPTLKYQQLMELLHSRLKRRDEGARAAVQQDPVAYHRFDLRSLICPDKPIAYLSAYYKDSYYAFGDRTRSATHAFFERKRDSTKEIEIVQTRCKNHRYPRKVVIFPAFSGRRGLRFISGAPTSTPSVSR